MRNKTFNIAFLVAVSFTMASCLKIDAPPYDRETEPEFWKNPLSAVQTVNACYQYLASTEEMLYSEAASDNGYCKVQDFTRDIGNGSYSPANHYVKHLWDARYAGIKLCNRLLNNINKVPELSDDLRKQYIGEAMALRALHYFELYSRFGDIPYYTHVITISESASISRTQKNQVIGNIIADLDEVINNNYLPTSYPASDYGRITSWAAKSIKARVLLFESRWEELKMVTEDIINNSPHELFTGAYEELFTVANEGNPEVILDVQYEKSLRENNTQSQFLPPSMDGYSQLAPLQELVESYIMKNGKATGEDGSGYNPSDPFSGRDPRLRATIIYDGNSYRMADGTERIIYTSPGAQPDGYGTSSNCSPTGYYLKKYWDNDYRAALMSGLNMILIRYADILLMNAEAYAETNDLTQAVWNKTIAPIRQRAGFTVEGCSFPSGKSTEQLIEIVRNERRSELAFEGLRMKDIYRWRIAENVMKGWCHGIYTGESTGTDNGYVRIEERNFDASKHYLWPIPQSDRDINKNLDKNPNW